MTRETFYSLLWQSTDSRFQECVCVLAGLTRRPKTCCWDDLPAAVRDRLRPAILSLLEAHEEKRQESKAASEREAMLVSGGLPVEQD